MAPEETQVVQKQAITRRALAMLRAVVAGRAQLSCSCEPDLFIDGVSCGDQFTAHALARAGLIQPVCPASTGQRVPAALTPAGFAALDAPAAA